MSRLVRALGVVALIAMLMAVAGFGRSASAQSTDAHVRIIHASPDAPAVDVFVNGARAIEDLAFGEATDLIALPAGDYDVAVVPSGADEADAVLTASLTLEAGMAYEVAAVGFLAEINAAVYPIDMSATNGDARVRVIHTSPDAPAVDIAPVGADPVISGLEFPNASDNLMLPAGTYDLEVRVAGTDTVALELPGVAFEADMVYDVFAIGSVEDGTLTVLPLVASAGGHTMPDTGVGATTSFSMLAAAIAILVALSAAVIAPKTVKR